MSLSRRRFIGTATATAGAFAGLAALTGCSPSPAGNYLNQVRGFGPLKRDRGGLFDLPDGFSYVTFSETGQVMSDELLVPGDHDGMACFPGNERDQVILIRNHELNPGEVEKSAFGPDHSLLDRINPSYLYDTLPGGEPHLGGTTTIHYNLRTRRVEREFLSLAGTVNNCAGGPTPWNSWISCEETLMQQGSVARLDHGWNFEVPASATGLVEPMALRGMGRFRHEAVAVDPVTGIAYQTEDAEPGLFTRFIPDHPGEYWRGGRLQALAIRGRPGADTRNWAQSAEPVALGETFDVVWVDLEAIHNPENDLATRGIAAGAANFTRGEGAWFGAGELYFCCTDGGPAQIGQIWRYQPSPHEGTPREREAPGQLTLFVESTDARVLEKCDNITIAPWGDLIVVEDGSGEQFIRGVTPAGQLYTIGRNAASDIDGEYSEITGPCFSPDGTTLFFNVQKGPGRTFAVRGPWERRSLASV